MTTEVCARGKGLGAARLFCVLAVTFVLGFMVAFNVVVVAVAAAVIAASTVVFLSLYSIKWAWSIFFFSICANGVAYNLAGLTLRPEYFTAPLFVVAIFVHDRRDREHGRTWPALGTPVYVGLAGWLLCALLSSTLIAPHSGASVRMLIQLSVALLAFVPVLRYALDIQYFLTAGTNILALISVGSVLFWATNPSRRISGLAFEYNVMGCLCAAWIAVLFYFGSDPEKVSRRTMVTSIPIIVALLLTSTRAAWIALVVIAVYWLARNLGSRPLSVLTGALLAVLGAAYVQQIYYSVGTTDSATYRVVHIADFTDGTGAYRLTLWNDAIHDITSRDWTALIGTGLNSFSQFHTVDPTNVSAAYLSSLWIGLFYDVGVVGALFFLIFMVGVFLRIEDKARAVPLFITLALCASLTNIIWFAFPWVFIALLLNSSMADEALRQSSARAARPGRTGAHRLRQPLYVPS